jgi:hypothetical protein
MLYARGKVAYPFGMRASSLLIGAALLGLSLPASADSPPAAPEGYPPPPMMVKPPKFDPELYPWVPTKMHSPGLMGGGIAFLALGSLSVLGGVTAVIVDSNSHGDFEGILSILVALPLFIHGAGCIAAGIPMTVVGARKVPAMPAWVPAPGWQPPMNGKPTSGTLRWVF